MEVSQNAYENLRHMQKAALAAKARQASKKPIMASIKEEPLEVYAIELEAEEYDQLCAVYTSKGRRMPSHYRRKAGFRRPATPRAHTLTAEQKKLPTCWH